MKVQLFIPCFVDQLYPHTGFNMVKVLEKAGCEVSYNPAQTCCGQPAFNAGFWDDSRDVCNKFLKDFNKDSYIVSPSASCVGFVRNYYTKLFENSSGLSTVKAMSSNIFELSEFLVKVLGVTNFNAKLEAKATYQCKIKNEPRQLLANVKGLELSEMNDVETCCGFGGTFAVKFESISIAMAEQKVDNALATEAKYIISTDLSCLMHIQGYIDNKGYGLQTLHLADVLANGW
jgi:L-lactate dehydrogenase complex protein LldE